MKRNFIRLVAVVLIALMLTALLPGCQKASETNDKVQGTSSSAGAEATGADDGAKPTFEKPVEITFWNGWTGADGVLLKELVDYYNENNKDNITVKMDIMEHQILGEKMAAALATNTAPNLFLNMVMCDYVLNDQFVPIDDIFEKTSLQKSDFIEEILDQMYYDGHLYGIPFQMTTQYLFWNKDLFKEAGLDPETPPKTYDEIQPMAERINNKGKNIVGGGGSYNDALFFAMMALSYGGKIMEGETADEYKAVITDPRYKEGNLKAMNIIKGLVDSGCIACQDAPQNEMAFFAGNMGMLIGGSSVVAGCKQNGLNFGVSLLPDGTEGIKQPGIPMAMVVMKGTSGDKLLATYKFIEYWNDNINNKYDQKSPAYQWSQIQGYQPYLKSVANDPELTADPVFEVTSKYVDYYTLWLPATFWNFFAVFFDVIPSALEGVMTNKTTPEKGLEDMQQQLESLISFMQQQY
jgi:multiple sugar transport system substrate-binding protein